MPADNMLDRPGEEVRANQTLAAPPEACPDPYKEKVALLDDNLQQVLVQ